MAEVSLGWNNAKLQAGAAGAAAIVQRTTNQMQATMNGLKGFNLGALLPVGILAAAVKEMMDIVVETDRMTRAMTTLEGSAQGAERRLAELREVAKLPGIGFQQAVAGDVRLRAVGLSASISRQALIEFGNALALAGGSAADLDGVILALGQIASKGKVSAEEINQIAERVPQIRKVMMDAFGTADTEAIQKMNISAEQFITQTIAGFSRLDRATAGLDESLSDISQNFRESVNAIAAPIINEAVPAFAMLAQTIADNKGGLEEFGKVGAGVFQSLAAMMEAATVIGFASTGKLMGDQRAFFDIINERYEEIRRRQQEVTSGPSETVPSTSQPTTPAGAPQASAEQREAAAESRRIEAERLALAEKQFEVWMSHQKPLQQTAALQKRILDLQEQAAGRDGPVHELERLKIEGQILDLKEKKRTLEKQAADDAEREKQKLADQAAEAAEIARTREQALYFLNQELAIIDAQNAGLDKKAKAMQRAKEIAEQTLRIMKETGLSINEATRKATAMADAKDKQEEGGRRRGRIRGYSKAQYDEQMSRPTLLDIHKDKQMRKLNHDIPTPLLDRMNEQRNTPMKVNTPLLDRMDQQRNKMIAPAPAANGKPDVAMEMPTVENILTRMDGKLDRMIEA